MPSEPNGNKQFPFDDRSTVLPCSRASDPMNRGRRTSRTTPPVLRASRATPSRSSQLDCLGRDDRRNCSALYARGAL